MKNKIAVCINSLAALVAMRGLFDHVGMDSCLTEEFGNPFWFTINLGDDDHRLPSSESSTGSRDIIIDLLDNAEFDTHDSVDEVPIEFVRLDWREALMELTSFPPLYQVEVGDFTIIADGSGAVSVGCQSFSAKEADAIVKFYHEQEDKLPNPGDESEEMEDLDESVHIYRDHAKRLRLVLGGDEIPGKYINVIDEFRKAPALSDIGAKKISN